MRILGIDPGYAIVGYGIIEYDNFRFKTVAYGAITTPANKPFADRLCDIYDDMNILIDKYRPDCMSIEKLYFNTNTTTAIDVAQARGAILLAARKNGMSVSEYTRILLLSTQSLFARSLICEGDSSPVTYKSFLLLPSIPHT